MRIRSFVHGIFKRRKFFLPVTIFVAVFFIFAAIWSQALTIRPDGLYGGQPFIWADWSLHLSMAYRFASLPPSHWFDSMPVYAGIRLNYPFVTNLISGFLLRTGLSLPLSFILPSLLFTFMLFAGIVWLGRKLGGSLFSGVVALLLFVGSGGLGAWYAHVPFMQLLTQSGVIYTQVHNANIEFTNVFLGMLFPQRAFLLGMPIGLLVISILFFHFITQKRVKMRTLFTLGLITGFMPIIHTHTFVVIFLMSAWFFLFSTKRIRDWLWYGIPAVLVSALCIFIFQYGTRPTANLFSIHLGWYADKSFLLWIVFWFRNWGVFLISALCAVGFFLWRKNYSLLIFTLGWWMIFIVANIIQFQPQSWDNSKLFAWVYLGLAFPVSSMLSVIAKKVSVAGKVFAFLLVILMMISGTLDILRLLNFPTQRFRMYSTEELLLGEMIRTQTMANAVFLGDDFVIQPTYALGGRTLFLGYPGWIYNFGLDYGSREDLMRQIYRGGTDTQQLLRDNGITYVYIGDAEKQKYFPNTEYFDAHYPIWYASKTVRIYDVTK